MALTFERASLDLNGRRVLQPTDARFEPGRVTVILGPNGAGKTSLLRAAAGLVVVEGGVAIDDIDLDAMPARRRARMVGYLPQQGEVAWNMTARDVVALGRLPHRTGAAVDDAAVDAAMRSTDTDQFAARRVGDLSGGERARVLLARVLAGEPDWLLADEPLASLDPAHQLDLLDRLREQAALGKGVIVVLHDLVQAARVADDAVLMAGGRILVAGPAADVLTADRLGDLYGVTMLDVPGYPICIPIERR